MAGWFCGGVRRALQEPTIDLRAGDEATSAPEPDVVLLSRTIREIAGRPGPGDLLLVAEVSGATLAFDLTVKAGGCMRGPGLPSIGWWTLQGGG